MLFNAAVVATSGSVGIFRELAYDDTTGTHDVKPLLAKYDAVVLVTEPIKAYRRCLPAAHGGRMAAVVVQSAVSWNGWNERIAIESLSHVSNAQRPILIPIGARTSRFILSIANITYTE